jgi:hypothetical protein
VRNERFGLWPKKKLRLPVLKEEAMSEKPIFAIPIFIKKWLKYGGKCGRIGKILEPPFLFKKAALMAYSQRIFLTFF